MMRNKNGSLNLSIQAIVILVMAMAILGLGLGFIRGLMGKGTEQFGTAIDNAQLENPATADNIVTVDRTVDFKLGKTSKVKIGFYNDGSGDSNTVEWEPTLICPGLDIDAAAQKVPVGEARGYEALIKLDDDPATNDPTKGTTVCTIEFKDGANTPVVVASKQFYVEVTA